MDAELLRTWLEALPPGEFAETLGRVCLLDGPSSLAMAVRLKRSEQTDSLITFYLESPREILGLLDLQTLSAMRGLADRPLPLRVRGLSGEERAALEELRRLGLAHRGRSGWLLSDTARALCDLTEEEMRDARSRDLLAGLTRGTLLLTGMLPFASLQACVGLPDGRWGERQLRQILLQRAAAGRYLITPRGAWLVSHYLYDPAAFYRQVTRPELFATPRAAFTAEQALQAHFATLPVLLPDAMPILRLVGEAGGDANIDGRELLFLAENVPIEHTADCFLERHPELRKSGLVHELPDLLLSLPLWRHLGHSEREIGRLEVKGTRVN